MKPEFNSRRLFGITRSKGKMFEFGLPEAFHIAVPPRSEPQELFLLTVGTLGDVAATVSEAEDVDHPLPASLVDELSFSASFFDAFLQSRFFGDIDRDTALLAASAYYLARRPGSSVVLARQLGIHDGDSPVDKLLHWALLAQWDAYPEDIHPLFGTALQNVARLVALHFHAGSGLADLTSALMALRRQAYEVASARDLLFIDIITAIVRIRMATSAWITLPSFSGIPADRWAPAIRRPEFPKELWPAQMLLGQAGIFSGASGVVQMPTSAGKTRSVEIILRSGFLSGRTKLAIVVAPFRALCHEIGTSLRNAFKEDDVKVNELSDAMQLDFLGQIAEWLGSEVHASNHILVLTPEKFLYVLRQEPSLMNSIGIVVYDEGHQFDSGSRGITYELLLTEIKALLPAGAQTVLVSAVIQNAQAVGEWLVGDDVKIVGGGGLLPTARSVAFASWIDRLGQLMFFESETYEQHDYFVPRVIEQHKLKRRPRERADRFFPERDQNDVALYLGIRLVLQGAVAIFCGRKDTASNMAARAVEIYERGFQIASPALSADSNELRRMNTLIDGHFGDQSVISRAASIGVFVHHGTTPHGIRLAVEYAMQHGKVNFVACTSTLAQGVNLPIRYLIVPGIHQGAERIKVRDFQNLVGRAGRSGMHTEGIVIFSDPDVFDNRQTERWKFESSVELLSPARAESTTSSLLELLAPLRSSNGRIGLQVPADELCGLFFTDEDEWIPWADEVAMSNPDFETKPLVAELRRRRRLIYAIESYLMANRGSGSFDDFKAAVEDLATKTLGYHLASDEMKAALITLFTSTAEYVQEQEPNSRKQAAYSKTLLGVRSAKAVDQWVTANSRFLLSLDSTEEWLAAVWQLLSEQSDDKFFHTVQPDSLATGLATRWVHGRPYQELFAYSDAENGSKPWGQQSRKLTQDDIVDFCESTLSFECSLVLSAVAQFVAEQDDIRGEGAAALSLFQKALKYGLPDWLSISCHECGFADRVLAQCLAHAVRTEGFSGESFVQAIEPHRARIEAVLKDYPSYFEAVLAGLVSR